MGKARPAQRPVERSSQQADIHNLPVSLSQAMGHGTPGVAAVDSRAHHANMCWHVPAHLLSVSVPVLSDASVSIPESSSKLESLRRGHI